jgi:hypothetical protein
MSNYKCALSGIKPKQEDIIDDEYPDGWIEITITKRYINPRYDAIQFIKESLVQQYLQNVPEEQREEQELAITIQVDAQYATLEQVTEKWETETETLYIADPDNDVALLNEYNKVRKMFGLKPIVRTEQNP